MKSYSDMRWVYFCQKKEKLRKKTAKETQLEMKLSDQDPEPVIPPLTGSSVLEVNLLLEPKIIDFVLCFLLINFSR